MEGRPFWITYLIVPPSPPLNQLFSFSRGGESNPPLRKGGLRGFFTCHCEHSESIRAPPFPLPPPVIHLFSLGWGDTARGLVHRGKRTKPLKNILLQITESMICSLLHLERVELAPYRDRGVRHINPRHDNTPFPFFLNCSIL